MTITPEQRDTNAFWEGLSTREMISEARQWLGVAATDQIRYPDAAVIRALNYGQNKFASRTSFLLMPVVVIGKANQMNYRLPYNALRIIAGRYYTGEGRSDYYELKIIRDMRRMQRLDSQFRGSPGQPEWLFPSYRAGNVPAFGLSPYPSIDGVTWTGSKYGVLSSATGFTNVGNVLGLHKTGFAASAFLVDGQGRDLTALGAKVGYPVLNVTDGSAGVITVIGNQDATNDKVSGTLAGGTNNYWSPNDSFQIPMSEYGVVTDAGGAETYTFSSVLGTILDIAGDTGNLILDVVRKPLPLSATLDTMVSEVPSDYQEAVIAWAVYWLGRASYAGVIQKDKAAEAMVVFENYVAQYLQQGDVAEESENCIETTDWWE